ncbi:MULTISPECIES: TonB-dependent receptor [Chryseobacterium]|uniref:TonB-dependent receptor n=1 Tax=Chryseobacterium caseinilyticum TaxID=2771428 RepID=A0ABR8ZH03_9FLAO|nr:MULTISPECIES: TonB-dependent receptor [Chryseobacterium]KQS95265.1 TonB-dependent receptor [Chryseobacterium sp. Leaf394]MBD8084359.1 TonB-dependent receptor [Chryseobacterium caseinilyticum]
MKLINRSTLTVLITLSTASVYYSQQVKDTLKDDKSRDIETVVIAGVADIAKDRKTPVAVSTIKEAQIQERIGNQELPELLNTTPSVYATKSGGGFGDSKINIRGFAQENIAVMVNGMPVNDMENGAVYWSNWAGLSDVTSAMQVQRGLGSSKLAIASVGGTINYITRAADKRQGGKVSVGVANEGYLKTVFSYNTGKSEKGWSSSFLMGRAAGAMYANGTDFEGYNYYFALGYQPNKKHDLQFTITGAPQWHNQRSTSSTIQNYIRYNADQDGTPNRRYNADWGFDRNGDQLSNRVNYYHKPVMSLNWDWKFNEKSKLNSVFYASFGRGGGTGDLGRIRTGVGTATAGVTGFVTPEGQIDYNAIFTGNAAVDVNNPATATQSTLIRRSSINSHNWFGAIISFNHKINDNINFTIGTDNRYYYGYHYQIISDLYGASGYKDNTNKNFYTAPGNLYTVTPRVVSNVFAPRATGNPFGGKLNNGEDKIGYDNDGEVLWYGGFGQIEYSNDKLSAFVQGAVSNQSFQRIDHFIIDGVTLLNGQQAGFRNTSAATIAQPTAANPALNTKTGFKDILGYNVKAGANYNIDDHHNVYANVGYYSKQPFLNAVYPNNKNFLNPNLTNEKIFGIEGGYGFRSSIFNANLNVYRTEWRDRFQRRGGLTQTYPDPTNPGNTITTTQAYSNIQGITEIHQGVELELTARPHRMLELFGMVSFNDYYYKGNAEGNIFTENNEQIGSDSQILYLDGVKVGSSAQTTIAGGFTIKPVEWFSFDATYRGADKLYANLNVLNFSNEASQNRGSLLLPSFGLVDLGISFKVKLKNPSQFFTLRGNVYNLLDKTYIAESNSNIHADLGLNEYIEINKPIQTTPLTAAQVTTLTNSYNTYKAAGNWNGISQQNQVYFGYGRTWSATLSFNF